MEIKIRKAEKRDAPFLATMILQSTRAGKKIGIFDYIFKTKDSKDTLACLEKMVVATAKSQCHYTNFLVAEVDGVDMGTICSYEPRIATKEVFIDALNETECVEVELEDLDILNECDFKLNKRTLMFDYLEEIPGHEDVGILKTLMQKSLLTARLKGYRIAQTIVEIGSLEIILDYKKLGFSTTKEKECELYKEEFGRIGLALMSIEF